MQRYINILVVVASVATLSACEYTDFSTVEKQLSDTGSTSVSADASKSDSDSDQDQECVPKEWFRDFDGDGFGDKKDSFKSCTAPGGYVDNDTDCDDKNEKVNPKAPEVCNSVDDNCNGQTDDNEKLWYVDSDGDGFGSDVSLKGKCDGKNQKLVDNNTDCNDSDATVFPGMTEKCNNKDDDCDGVTDEADAEDVKTWFEDADKDSFGNKTEVKSCHLKSGLSATSDDCDDKNKDVHPGATEVCNEIDDNCDGVTDEGLKLGFYPDADEDGFGDSSKPPKLSCTLPKGHVSDKTDCNDANKGINSKATEVCDGVDNNCDGKTDEGVLIDVFADSDGDGHGDKTKKSTACKASAGFAVQSDDCNDADKSVYAGAPESCNGVDDDCDGVTDENDAVDAKVWYYDGDQDGFGLVSKAVIACNAPSGYVADKTDCDDLKSAVNPKADELCNGFDDNCDGKTDGPDSKDQKVWYEDSDGDGFGQTEKALASCNLPKGFAAKSGDCDSAKKDVNPGTPEVCDGVDNNCDGVVDEGVTKKFFKDNDGDGHGIVGVSTEACAAPKGFAEKSDDCDDQNTSVFTGALEVCDGVDNNCDGKTDEGVKIMLYADTDGDGYGDAKKLVYDCAVSKQNVANKTDCDDTKSTTFPGADEYCNDVDDDCDGVVDESDAKDVKTWYFDGDGDKFGSLDKSIVACKAPAGYTADNKDCLDSNSNGNPAADELCNGIDDDCDGLTDESDAKDQKPWYLDEDGDGYGVTSKFKPGCTAPTGYVAKSGDCDDKNKDVNPGASELCDGKDNNCDGVADEGVTKTFYKDVDGDGFGDAKQSVQTCAALSGHVVDNTDCNDSEAKANPGSKEVCDGIDNNCNGKTDEPSSNAPICDDGDVLTIDSCEADKGCKNVSTTFTFTCKLPEEYPAKDGNTCSVGIFFGKGATYGALSVAQNNLTVSAKDVCAQLKDGKTLFVNSLAASPLGSAAWVGGFYVGLVYDETKKEIKGTPGDVTILIPGLDFNFVLADFNICK